MPGFPGPAEVLVVRTEFSLRGGVGLYPVKLVEKSTPWKRLYFGVGRMHISEMMEKRGGEAGGRDGRG